jgi:hypothetical protein
VLPAGPPASVVPDELDVVDEPPPPSGFTSSK